MADDLGITNTATPPTQPATPETAPTPAPQPAADPVQEATALGGPLGGAAVGALKSAAQHENTPESAPPTIQSTGKTVRMVNPAGLVGEVPEEKAADAAKSGYKTVVQMTNPKGEVGNVPVEKSHDALAAGYKFGQPIKDTSSVSAAPSVSGGDVASAITEMAAPFKQNRAPIQKVSDAIDNAVRTIENYTPQGREEHPVLAQVGDLVRTAKNFLLGGGADTQNPFAIRTTNAGLLNNPLTAAMAAAPEAAEAGAATEDAIVGKVKNAASKIGEVTEDMFKHAPEVPKAQHGAPVPVNSPLDRATVNAVPGGKELSSEAFNTLQQHVGDAIPAGSTPKNTMMKAVKPVLRTIEDTGSQLTKVIHDAPAFETSVLEDPNSTVLKDIQDIREKLPLKEDDPLNKVVDKWVQANYDALNSKNPEEILAARRKLSDLDWANLTWNPETAGEVANTTKAKLYHALGNKLKTIDKVAELDKTLQPNLELRSHFDEKLGKAVSRDPVEAEAQSASEHQKGLAQLENEAHNAKVNKNIAIAKKVAALVGTGAAAGLGFDLAK